MMRFTFLAFVLFCLSTIAISKQNNQLLKPQKIKKGKLSLQQKSGVKKPRSLQSLKKRPSLPEGEISIDDPRYAPDPRKPKDPESLKLRIDDMTKKMENDLEQLCLSKASINERFKAFQKTLSSVQKEAEDIQKRFYIDDPSYYVRVGDIAYYLGDEENFNYKRSVPKNQKETLNYIENLLVAFDVMLRVAYNIPENIPVEDFDDWMGSVGKTLICLSQNK